MIFLKYTERFSQHKSKLSAGFYVVIACCLLIIGGAAWFALSNYADDTDVTSKAESQRNDVYNNNTSSYNESVTQPSMDTAPVESVAQSVSDEVYSSDPQTSQNIFSMPVQGEILKNYSATELQFSETYKDMRLHSGIDIACENGTSISACANGTVLSIEPDASLGNVVTIDHGNGITVKYASLDELSIKQSDSVSVGDIIGKSTTVPCESNDRSHIHIEVFKDGTSVEPLEALGLK